MEPFITFKDKDKTGALQYYILQRKYPHYVGVILYSPKEGALAESVIPGYNLFISFAGTINGNFIPAKHQIELELTHVFQNMAQWFFICRIQSDPSRYKKWAIKPI